MMYTYCIGSFPAAGDQAAGWQAFCRTVSGYREYPPIRFLEWGGRKGFAFLASPDRSVEATPAVGSVRQSGNGDIRMYASLYAAPFRLV